MKKIKIESWFFVIGFIAFCGGLWLFNRYLSLILGGLVLMGMALPRGEK